MQKKNESCGESLQKTNVMCWGPGEGRLSGEKIVYFPSSKQISKHSEIDKSTVRSLFSVGRWVCPSVRLSVVRSFARSII